jgi:hypothetical protein
VSRGLGDVYKRQGHGQTHEPSREGMNPGCGPRVLAMDAPVGNMDLRTLKGDPAA